MNTIAMLAVSAVLVTNAAPVSIASMTPRERMEWRKAQTQRMHDALKWDEARREAFRYEWRKRILNKAASDLQRIAGPSNAVVSVSVDYKSGDILVEYADGHRLIQRFTPKPEGAPARKVRPKATSRKYDPNVDGVWKWKAADGVNEIIRYPDGTIATTLAHVVEPSPPIPQDAVFIPCVEKREGD